MFQTNIYNTFQIKNQRKSGIYVKYLKTFISVEKKRMHSQIRSKGTLMMNSTKIKYHLNMTLRTIYSLLMNFLINLMNLNTMNKHWKWNKLMEHSLALQNKLTNKMKKKIYLGIQLQTITRRKLKRNSIISKVYGPPSNSGNLKSS